MFAVIKTGGKQYTVAPDDLIKVEKLAGEPGDMVEISQVMMVGKSVGAPFVDGALVTAEIVEQGRARKVIAFKKRRRQNSRRTIGHRQHFTMLQISEILTDGAKPSKKAGASKKAAAPKKKTSQADAAPAEGKTTPVVEGNEADRHLDTKDADKAAARKADKAPAKAKSDDTPAALFTRPEGEPDDLKKISGVGPVLEKKLHDFGVTQFEQVAAFSKEDIDRLDEALSFKGRIERDDWVGQAKKLAAE